MPRKKQNVDVQKKLSTRSREDRNNYVFVSALMQGISVSNLTGGSDL